MIKRYEVDDISRIWTEQARFERLLSVELALLETLEELGLVPAGTRAGFDGVRVNPVRIREIEEETRHDVIAFCTSITEQVDPALGRYFHYGVTSSDVLDSALSLQIKDSVEVVMESLQEVLVALDRRIEETRDLLCIGRSHGITAEPMIFAQKLLSSRTEFARRLSDFEAVIDREITGQLSGAVGNYTFLTPAIEAQTLRKLGLPVEPVSSQVIPRDRLAKIVSVGALTASAIERLAIEIRLLHHSDVGEVNEGFRIGQKGSSVMPHKRNPVSSENLGGLARVIRSQVEIAHQNILLWHERDLSHSSTERLYLPDHFGLLAYSLRRLRSTIDDLVVHRERIESKVRDHFHCLSSRVLHSLLNRNGVAREELYSLVQETGFAADSIEDWSGRLAQACSVRGFRYDPAVLSFEGIKKEYQTRFDEVLDRTREDT